MRRLIWLSVIITGVLSITIALVSVWGRQKSPPDSVVLLHLSDCKLPCWLGIMPGQTTQNQAHILIVKAYGGLPDYLLVKADSISDVLSFSVISTGKGDEKLQIDCYTQQEIINACFLTWHNYRNAPRIGDVESMIGSPLKVRWAERSSLGHYYSDRLHHAAFWFPPNFSADAYHARFDFATRLVQIVFFYSKEPDQFLAWQGFTDIHRYLDN